MRKIYWILLIFFILLVSTFGYILFTDPGLIIVGPGSRPNDYFKTDCQALGGNWIEEYRECATDNSNADIKGFCNKYTEYKKGKYTECASACRHNIDPEIVCTAQCVQVCSFG